MEKYFTPREITNNSIILQTKFEIPICVNDSKKSEKNSEIQELNENIKNVTYLIQKLLQIEEEIDINNKNLENLRLNNEDLLKSKEEMLENINFNILTLPEMTEYLKTRNESREAIFFTETTANGKVKARFVCALESAARVNPNSDIYLLVLTTAPYQLNLTENVGLDFVRKYHPNIQILACDLNILFKGTIIEEFYRSGKLENSTFKAAHTSDIIRVYVLWKYGGKYFDLDIIFLKPMSHIINFAVEQDFTRRSLNNGMLGFTKNSSVALDILTRSIKNFNGKDWAANGPSVVSTVIWEICGFIPVVNYTEAKCKGFTVIKNWEFFPINYDKLYMYFDKDFNRSETTMSMIDSKMPVMYAIHVGNNIVKEETIHINSKQPYGLLAQRYCPRAYWTCHSLF
jgi:lactosylceramide 4-alpha-galactosyltransferase